jgi:hypothetical protein
MKKLIRWVVEKVEILVNIYYDYQSNRIAIKRIKEELNNG